MKQDKQIVVNSTTTSETEAALYAWLKSENKLISAITEERISNASVLCMCNVSVAFVAMILSANYSFAIPIVGMACHSDNRL